MELKSLRIRSDLNEQEKRKLLALLAVRKARGLSIPQIDMADLSASDGWGVDENGYFRRNGTGKEYDPAPGHAGFIASTAVFVGLAGGRGSGKTAAGAQKAMRKVKEGRTGVVVNPDLENFKTSTWPELRNWIPWEMVIPRHRIRRSEAWDVTRPFSVVFLNGAIIYCRGLRDPESARGHNVNWLWYDEARRDKTGAAWKNAIAGVRIGTETQRFVTTTPAGTDSWIAALFDRQEVPQEVYDLLEELGELNKRPLIESFHVSLHENRKNLDPIFYATLISAYPAGYLRQREVDGIAANSEGALGDRTWFANHIIENRPEWTKRVRYWDLAASEKKVGEDPDETVGSLVSCDEKKVDWCLEDQVSGFWAWEKIKSKIKETAYIDGPQIPIFVEQEPASGGKNQVAEIASLMRPLGFIVKAHDTKQDGDRVIAAQISWFAEAFNGHWSIVRAPWNAKFFIQLDSFPDEGSHDDKITSVTGARLSIAPIRRFSALHFDHIGSHKKEEKKTEGTGGMGAWGRLGK